MVRCNRQGRAGIIIKIEQVPHPTTIPTTMHVRSLALASIFILSLAPGMSCANDPVMAEPTPPVSEVPLVGGDGASGTITVNPAVTYQTMDGFGTSLRLFDDPHVNGLAPTAPTGGIIMTAAQRDTIYDLLYSPTRGIALNRLRAHLSQPGWQTREGGPLFTDGPYPGPRAAAAIDFIEKARTRNAELRTGFQIAEFDSWIDRSTSPLTIARYIKTTLDYARSRRHEPDWAGIQNEPSNGMPYFSGENLRDIAIELKNLLAADGYATKIAAPDDLTDGAGAPKAAIMLRDPAARSSLKALSIHLYGNQSPTQMAALAHQYSLPLWMTEFDDRIGGNEIGWASAIVHEMIVNYNVSAVDMLAGFLGSPAFGSPGATYITLNSSGTSYRGYTLNPSYFQTGHWSKYVTRGSVRIAAESTNPNVKVSAFTKAGKKVIVLIHSAENSASVAIPPGNYQLIRTQMSGSDRLTDKGVFKTAVILPGMSISTLVER